MEKMTPRADDVRRSLRNVIAVMVSALPAQADRNAVLESAKNYSYGLSPKGMQPFWCCIPSGASPALTQFILDGLSSTLSSIAQASKGETVESIMRRANAIGINKPVDQAPDVAMGGDPITAPTVAASLLAAKMAGADVDDDVALLAALTESQYDCVHHEFVLGGSPLEGGFLGDLWTKIKTGVSNLFSKEGQANAAAERANKAQVKADQAKAEAWSKRLSAAIASGVPYDQAVQQVTAELGPFSAAQSALNSEAAATTTGEGMSPTDLEQPSPVSALLTGAGSLSSRLESLKAALAGAKQQQEATKDQLYRSEADLARLAWMQAIAEAPDSVVDSLKAVIPQFSTPVNALQTAADLLSSARDGSDTSKMKALTTVLRSLRAKQPGAASLINQILSGGEFPEELPRDAFFSEQDPTSPALALHARMMLADAKGGEL